ncbi:uncharacterized protein znf518b [Clarias gariepinus]|uniref:uncharacterized protein LOC128544057 n=1 Tax=Clarias gariepinus TaxID=13013 RepID=UPI00234C12E7|nr:uncharacterized protein LOC128544057 [Clarias gariepinus]
MEERSCWKGLLQLSTPTNGSFIYFKSTDYKSVLAFFCIKVLTMNSSSLQQNFILFLEKAKEFKDASKNINERLCCDKCRFSTKDTALFERHVSQHKEVTFSCTICNHISYSRVESQRHLVKHKGSFPYKCNWCPYGAVRRDYMVKHIQRIHGKSADGIFMADCTKTIEGTKGPCLSTPRTLGGPSNDAKVVSHSSGNMPSLLCSAGKTRPSAPYHVTSTTCSLPIKPQPCIVPSTTNTVCTQGIFNPPSITVKEVLCLSTPRTLGGTSNDVKVVSHSAGHMPSTTNTVCTQGIFNPPSMTVKEVLCLSTPRTVGGPSNDVTIVSHSSGNMPSTTNTICTQGIFNPPAMTVKELFPTVGKTIEYIQKMTEKSSLGKNAVTSALPRVHVGIAGDRAVQQKLPLQSQVVGSTEKTVVQSKIIPKIQVGLPVSNNNHLKTLLSNQREAPVAQKSVTSATVQNIPVAHVVQRSAPSSANTTTPVERFRQVVPTINRGAQATGKKSQHKTRPNILVRTPHMTLESSAKSGVQPGLLAPSNQPIQHNRPLMIPGSEERNPPRSSVQVELLAPLNQPIQHNKPLTVSCPEEITIPAGCLVELVEVKNVNGTRELELRLVPQQLPGPQPEDLKNSTIAATASRLSFKCRVATDDNQQTNVNQEMVPKANAISEHLVQESHIKKFSSDNKLNVKNEAEVNERVQCSRKNGAPASGSLSKWLHAPISKSMVSNPSEAYKFTQQLCSGHKSVATDPVKPLSHMHCTVKNISPNGSNKNLTVESLKYELRAAEPSSNKMEDAELSHQGLPVISSVFSLCPIPQNTSNHIHTREAEARISVVPASSESIKTAGNPKFCRPTMKTEDDARLLPESVQKCGQSTKRNDDILEEPKAPESIVKEKFNAMGMKTLTNDEQEKMTPESLTNALQTDPSSNVSTSSVSKNDCSSKPEKIEKTQLDSEKSLPTKSDSPVTSSMNPIVSLIRIPNLELFSVSESVNKVQEKRDGEESVTARPVMCCTSNQQNLQEKTIKLVLKRKWSETKTDEDPRLDLVCNDLPPTNKKAKKVKRAKKHKSSKEQQLLGNGTMFLMPLKDDQLVKLPGPNQPVVVLNHPNPLVHVFSVEGQTLNDQHPRKSVSDLSNPDGVTLCKPERTCPAFKLTLKKVQGQMYQVTELLVKGVSERTMSDKF